MKCIFINLPAPHLGQPLAQVPLGILYLAAVLRNKIDVEVKNYSSLTITKAIQDLPESNIYGITCTSMQLLQVNQFAKRIKQKYPNSKIILGGHGTASPEFVNWNYVDAIVQGECEGNIFEILNDLYRRTSTKSRHFAFSGKRFDKGTGR